MFKELWRKFILTILKIEGEVNISRYKFLKKQNDLLVSLKSELRSLLLITIGIFSAGFGFKGFFN